MKGMTILKRCRNAQNDIDHIQQRILRRRDAMECITQQLSATGSRASGDHDKIGDFVADLTKLEADMKKRELAHSVEVAAVCVLLDNLPENESSVLHAYYVKRMKTQAIAKRMKYTEGYIRKLKKEGERLIDDLPAEKVAASLPGWYLREIPDD